MELTLFLHTSVKSIPGKIESIFYLYVCFLN